MNCFDFEWFALEMKRDHSVIFKIASKYCISASLMAQVEVSACDAGDLGSIPGLGRSPGEGNGNPFQYSCLENPMDRGVW